MTACRIGIVEDHTVVITGLRQILEAEPDLDIVAAAPTVAELLDLEIDVDMAILDLRLPDGSSPAANVTDLHAAGITKVLVFTSGEEPTWCGPPRGRVCSASSTRPNAIPSSSTRSAPPAAGDGRVAGLGNGRRQ